MIRQLPTTTLLTGLAVLTAACGDDGSDTRTGLGDDAEDSADPSEESSPEGAIDDLLGRTYVSVDVTEDGSERPLVEGTEIEITFHDDPARLGWSAGCNDFGTDTLEIDGDHLIVGDGNGTLIGCDEERHEQDEWLQGVLSAEPTWSLDGDTLTLETDTTVIELEASGDAPDGGDPGNPESSGNSGQGDTPPTEPQPDDAPAGPDPAEESAGGPDDGPGTPGASALEGRTWRVTDLVDGENVTPVDPGAEATLSVDGGNLGIDACNTGGSTVHEITEGEIEVDPPIMTMMACGPPLDEVERAIVAVLDGRVAYVVDGDQLTLTHPAGHGLVLTAAD